MTYKPRIGSVADRAIRALAGSPVFVTDLCAQLKVPRANMDGCIAAAIKAGSIVRETVDGRAQLRLPTAQPGERTRRTPRGSDAPQFSAALYIDGELDIFPTLEIDGGIRLTAEQVERLRALLCGVPLA